MTVRVSGCDKVLEYLCKVIYKIMSILIPFLDLKSLKIAFSFQKIVFSNVNVNKQTAEIKKTEKEGNKLSYLPIMHTSKFCDIELSPNKFFNDI